MRVRIAELCETLLLALLRLLLPAPGRHRAAGAAGAAAAPQHPDHERPLTAPHSPPGHPPHPLDIWSFEPGTDLVRPYLLTPAEHREHRERRERHERRLRRQRRRALWLATYGIDAGPRHIHGVEVAA